MDDLTIKTKILKTLLESPKTTGQIAIELGYIDKNGHGRYNIIKPDLDTLEKKYKFIVSNKKSIGAPVTTERPPTEPPEHVNGIWDKYPKNSDEALLDWALIELQKLNKKSVGAPATTYDVVYEISVIKQIWKKHPELMIDLQNSYFVLETIKDFILGEKYVFHEDMIKWLRLSPSFFEYCLNNDYETIKKRWKEYFILNSNWGLDRSVLMVNAEGKRTNVRDEYTDDQAATAAFYDTIEKIYEHCVSTDVLNGYSNPEAIDEIREKRKEIIERNEYSFMSNSEKICYLKRYGGEHLIRDNKTRAILEEKAKKRFPHDETKARKMVDDTLFELWFRQIRQKEKTIYQKNIEKTLNIKK